MHRRARAPIGRARPPRRSAPAHSGSAGSRTGRGQGGVTDLAVAWTRSGSGGGTAGGRPRRRQWNATAGKEAEPLMDEHAGRITIIASSTMVHHRVRCLVCDRPVDHRVVFMTNDARVLHAGCVPDHVKVPISG